MAPQKTDTARRARRRVAPADAVLELLDSEGDSIGRAYPVLREGLEIGRDGDADVPVVSPLVSRRHARVEARNAEHVLVDLGSTNGTAVNGTRVTERALRDGDLVQIAGEVFRYRIDDGGWAPSKSRRAETRGVLVRAQPASTSAVPSEPSHRHTRGGDR